MLTLDLIMLCAEVTGAFLDFDWNHETHELFARLDGQFFAVVETGEA